MNAWWQMWEENWSPVECEQIIEAANRVPESEATVGHGGNSWSSDEMRKSSIRWLDRLNPEFRTVFDKVEHHFRVANNAAFGFHLNYLGSLQFTEYRVEYEGHYDWHEDLTWVRSGLCHRKLSIIVQLSDPGGYDGGNLVLAQEPPTAERLRKQGTVIVFPSFLRHKVEPMTRGVRYSLVGWYEGPKFR